jgi:acetyltransferase-like isoleucine patch superfamily enzyme
MTKRIFQKILIKTGKTYAIDESVPNSLLLEFLYNRFIMMCRGMIFLKKKVFLGTKTKISNKKNITFGKNVTIENYVVIDGYAKNKIVFGDFVKIGSNSIISCTSHLSMYGIGLTIGNNSAVGRFTEFGSAGGIKIGNDVIMGSYISFHSQNHNFDSPDLLIREQGVTSKGIELKNNIWVGAKVTFLDGSIIGNNSVVAAGSLVKGVFPDNVVIGGVPAKIIKHLFE